MKESNKIFSFNFLLYKIGRLNFSSRLKCFNIQQGNAHDILHLST